jgi:hypothetical protein
LVGDQEQFEETRNMITYWMAQNKKKIDKIFGPEKNERFYEQFYTSTIYKVIYKNET